MAPYQSWESMPTKLIDYIRLVKQDLCPHCFPNHNQGDAATWLVCGKSSITMQVTENTGPCTLRDWEECPLNEHRP